MGPLQNLFRPSETFLQTLDSLDTLYSHLEPPGPRAGEQQSRQRGHQALTLHVSSYGALYRPYTEEALRTLDRFSTARGGVSRGPLQNL